MAPVIPQPNISPGRADVPGTQDLAQAFNAQIIAERERKSPVESFTEGVGQVQQVVQNQQAIELNELERERRQLAINIQKEQEAEDLQFTRALNSGNPDDQLNALLTASPEVLARNADTARVVAERVKARGSDAQRQVIEEELMPVLDPVGARQMKAIEAQDQNARERIRLQNKLITERQREAASNSRLTPEEQEMQRLKLEDQRMKNEAQRRKLSGSKSGLDPIQDRSKDRADIKRDVQNFSDQLRLSDTTIVDPATGETAGERRAEQFNKAASLGFAAFDRSDGAAQTIGGQEFKTQREFQRQVEERFLEFISEDRREIFERGLQVQGEQAREALSPQPTPESSPLTPKSVGRAQVKQEIQNTISELVTRATTNPTEVSNADIEKTVSQIMQLSQEAGLQFNRSQVRNTVLKQLGQISGR